jgi:hypothetical protein
MMLLVQLPIPMVAVLVATKAAAGWRQRCGSHRRLFTMMVLMAWRRRLRPTHSSPS